MIYGAERKANVLVDSLDLLELSLPHRKAILGTLSRSRALIEGGRRRYRFASQAIVEIPGKCVASELRELAF
jgi:hypothetical protein